MTGGSRVIRKNILEAEFKMNKNYPGGFDDEMSIREAMLILNVKSNKEEVQIKMRHKKLIIKNHPDKGGSTLLARKINEAKEVLLK